MKSIRPGENIDGASRHRMHEYRFGRKHENNRRTQALLGSISLVTLKTEILSALSSVSSATTKEELQQADAAYKKALCTARSVGYRPHIRAADGQQIQVEWVALGKAPFFEAPADIVRQGL
jgi:hypothetical protein